MTGRGPARAGGKLTNAVKALNAIAEVELKGVKLRRRLCHWCHQELIRAPFWRWTGDGTEGEGPPQGYMLIHQGPDEAKACGIIRAQALMKRARPDAGLAG